MSRDQFTAAVGADGLHRTACPLDCPDTCSLVVEVDDGKAVRFDGDDRNPFTRGFICSKVRRYARHVYGEERLTEPLRRRGAKGSGDFESITWDEALDAVAEALKQARDRSGGESILPLSYGGSNGVLSQDTTDARLFRRLGASGLARTVCAAPSTMAANLLYGKMAGCALEDFVHSRLIIVWGANPSATGIHLVPTITEAQRNGAKLVVVDPVRTRLAARADLHLGLRPGTDLAFALALLAEIDRRGATDRSFLEQHANGADQLLEEASRWTLSEAAAISGLEEGDLQQLLDLYLATDPAVIRCGWGVERNRNGTSAVAAILALPAIAGKFGVRGGGFTMSNSGYLSTASAAQAEETPTRTVNMNRVGRVLTGAEGSPVDALFVYNCNPLVTLPHQVAVEEGLRRDDLFTVVFDQVMTDTALYADIVLPATTFLEHRDTRKSYGVLLTQQVHPVIEPVGQARSNVEVFAELIRRLDLERDGDVVDPEGLEGLLFEGHAETARQLRDSAMARLDPLPVQFADRFPATASGKIELFPAEVAGQLYAYLDESGLGTERYPLALISPATRATVSSTFGQLVKEPAGLSMHPSDAETRRLRQDQSVRVFNEFGEVVCALQVTEDVAPGVVLLPKGIWRRHTSNGWTSNALSPDSLEALSGGACFNDARVEVEAAG
ncbi:MAG: molybdopterin-dependent oxidoreductase [Acidobacteriota bacterium]